MVRQREEMVLQKWSNMGQPAVSSDARWWLVINELRGASDRKVMCSVAGDLGSQCYRWLGVGEMRRDGYESQRCGIKDHQGQEKTREKLTRGRDCNITHSPIPAHRPT